MCIGRLWPYWLLHWRTRYYGLLTIIALYIGYLITFGCYLKAKWFIVYLWKGTTTECLVNVFMGNQERDGVNVKVWGTVYVRLHDRMKLRRWFFKEMRIFLGKNILKLNCCSDIPMSAIQVECSALYSSHHAWLQCSVYIVNSCTQLYTSFCSLYHYTLAYLLFTVSLIFCTRDRKSVV